MGETSIAHPHQRCLLDSLLPLLHIPDPRRAHATLVLASGNEATDHGIAVGTAQGIEVAFCCGGWCVEFGPVDLG